MKPTLNWQIASVTNIKPENTKVKSFTLTLPAWMPHRAGQHYDIRLTTEDGYQTQRSYSIASEPERAGEVDITVERIDDGEVVGDGRGLADHDGGRAVLLGRELDGAVDLGRV